MIEFGDFCGFFQEEKKPEEKKPEEAKKGAEEEKKKEEPPKAEEKKAAAVAVEESKDSPPPPPPQEIILKVYMHCEGCARKVRRCLRGFEGVFKFIFMIILFNSFQRYLFFCVCAFCEMYV